MRVAAADARPASSGWPSRASRGPDDAVALAAAGYDAVLVGEPLVTAGDPDGGARAPACAAGSRRTAARRPATGSVRRRVRQDLRDHQRGGRPAGGRPWAPTPSASSSPRRPARWRPARCGTSSGRLPPEILTVGVFRDERPQQVVEIVHDAGLRGGPAARPRDPRGHAEPCASRVGLVIKALRRRRPGARARRRLRRRRHAPRRPRARLRPGLRLVAGRGRARSNRRVILAGGLTPENVADGIEAVRPVGRRRVDRRRGRRPGPQGPPQGAGLHPAAATAPAVPPPATYATGSDGPSSPTTGRPDDRDAADRRGRPVTCRPMGEPDRTGRFGELRRALRARDPGAGLRELEAGVPRGVGRPRLPGRARRPPARLRRSPVAR